MRRDVQRIKAMGSTIELTILKSGEVFPKNLGIIETQTNNTLPGGIDAIIRLNRNDARDKRMYELRMDGRTLKEIQQEIVKQGYPKISEMGITNAITRYCERKGLKAPRYK
jgi:hypothetical protein